MALDLDKYRYLYFGFDPAGETPGDNEWIAKATLSGSNDATTWKVIKQFPQLGQFRDGFMAYIKGWYYIVGTLAMYKTKDFDSFTKLDIGINNSNYTEIYAPELFQDTKNNWHLCYCAKLNGVNAMYVADFDPQTDKVSNTYQKITINDSNPVGIDPSIHYIKGYYYMLTAGNNILKGRDYLGPYDYIFPKPAIDPNNQWYEAPELLVDGVNMWFYADRIDGHVPGIRDSGYMVYYTGNINNMTSWSMQRYVKSDINMRHGSFMISPEWLAEHPDYSHNNSGTDDDNSNHDDNSNSGNDSYQKDTFIPKPFTGLQRCSNASTLLSVLNSVYQRASSDIDNFCEKVELLGIEINEKFNPAVFKGSPDLVYYRNMIKNSLALNKVFKNIALELNNSAFKKLNDNGEFGNYEFYCHWDATTILELNKYNDFIKQVEDVLKQMNDFLNFYEINL